MDYIKRTEELVTPILERSGFELYDIEMLKESGAKVLRVYIPAKTPKTTAKERVATTERTCTIFLGSLINPLYHTYL